MRVKNVKRVMFLVVLPLVSACLYMQSQFEREYINDVKSGNKTLVCNIDNEKKKIDPKLVEDHSDGVWYFTNGYSKSCTVGDNSNE